MPTTLLTVLATIAVALISLLGTVYTTKANSAKIEAELEKHQAVQDTKLDELTREVRQHNDFATRIPVIETRLAAVENELLNRRGA